MNIWRRMLQTIGMPGGDPQTASGSWGRFAPLPGLEAGAARRRMAPFVPVSEHVNSLLRNAGDTTLARARWLVRNNGYAKAALQSWTTATVGPGIKPSPRIDDPDVKAAVTQAFTDWTDEADAENLTDFYGIARRVSRECYIAGESFVRLVPRRADRGLLVPLQLQVLPSEQLPLWKSEMSPNGRPIRLGIEFDDDGTRAAYWFWRTNPTDATMSFTQAVAINEVVRVPADEILHVYDPVEAGQLRGLSSFAAAIVKMFMMDVYDDAELERKKQAARFATFITRAPTNLDNLEQDLDQPGTATDAGGNDTVDPYYGPGAFMMLGEGDDVKFSAPADVGPNYEPFQYRVLLQICSALGVPYGELSYDLSRATYASSRAGLLAFRGAVEAFQFAVLVYQFLRPVYRRWLQTAVVAGAVPISAAAWNRDRARLQRFQAITPRAPWVDPLKDIQAEALSVTNGFKSRSSVIEAQGYDPEEVDQQIADERERAEDLGLPEFPIRTGPMVGPATARATPPQSEPTTTGEEAAA